MSAQQGIQNDVTKIWGPTRNLGPRGNDHSQGNVRTNKKNSMTSRECRHNTTYNDQRNEKETRTLSRPVRIRVSNYHTCWMQQCKAVNVVATGYSVKTSTNKATSNAIEVIKVLVLIENKPRLLIWQVTTIKHDFGRYNNVKNNWMTTTKQGLVGWSGLCPMLCRKVLSDLLLFREWILWLYFSDYFTTFGYFLRAVVNLKCSLMLPQRFPRIVKTR
jgi:hypothetical protein